MGRKKKNGKSKASSNNKNAVKTNKEEETLTVNDKQQQHWTSRASAFKEEGNAAFSQKNYSRAVEAYTSGLELLQQQHVVRETTTAEDDEEKTLHQTLYSNRAMAYLKLESFQKAEQDCCRCLEVLDQSTTTTTVAKVWYRRALAREGLARSTTTTNHHDHTIQNHNNNNPQDWLLAAKQDLQESMQALQGAEQQDAMKRAILTVATRIQRLLTEWKERGEQQLNGSCDMNGVVNHGVAETNHQHPPVPLHPPMEQQHQDVLRLLQSRMSGLQTATTKRVVAMEGEAIFLIDWQWWSWWCRYVQFFETASDMSSDKLLSYLPPGAHLPNEIDTDDDDDSSNTSMHAAPGPIDNRKLLLPFPEKVTAQTPSHQVYVDHWYQAYRQQQQQTTTQSSPSSADSNKENKNGGEDQSSSSYHSTSTASLLPALRPNLVRGHDYEALPREVYAALRAWYGEVTPSLCFRCRTTDPTNETNLQLLLYAGVNSEPSLEATSTTALYDCEACGSPKATSRCRRCLAVRYCNRGCQESHWSFHKMECKELAQNESIVAMAIRPTRGRVGLNNLGNTCFMNSALQSLSHATPLTRHFLSGRFRADLNPSNPLGTGGKLAHAYDAVMKELWMRGSSSSCSPTALKRAIALFAPRFAGCLQHDAQEFLAYLLDGLHEDLNRIRKAPYVEMPDVTDGHDMAVAGARAWEAHRRRNDSLVLDTFYGQFKSTCVCPKCSRVSVSFDAFNHVSLEIPQAKNAIVSLSVLVFPAPTDGATACTPVRYGVEIRRTSPIEEVRQSLSRLSGIAPERLLLCEVFEHNVVDMLKVHRPVSDIRVEDTLVAYEVDPFTSTTMYVVLTHNLVDEMAQMRLFGFPFMTSFPAQLTCRQIWDHIWGLVSQYVSSSPESESGDRELLKIRLRNGRGKSVRVFPVETNGEEEKGKASEDVIRTAYLPEDLDEKLTTFLGEDATESFLFLTLDWSEVATDDSANHEGEAPPSKIDEKRFLLYQNHSSWLEVAKKLKATVGEKKAVTLDQCFDAFTKPERLDEHNKWYCSNCKEHVQAMKTMELWRLPNVLIVHLKRFEFKHALRRDKLDSLVEFPLEGLDMSRHCASADNGEFFIDDTIPAVYDLFAVTNHYGRMGFGHYTAFARSWDETSLSEEWALFDDSSVRSVGDGRDSVVSPAAYVLFYRRRLFN